MNRTALFPLFGLACAVQLAAPSFIIVKHEAVLRHGQLFRFRTAPVDPYDAFRGRYVAVRAEADTVPMRAGSESVYPPGTKVFASVAVDGLGFAWFSSVGLTPPPQGDYVSARAAYISTFPEFTVQNLKNPGSLAVKVHEAQDPVSVYLRSKLIESEAGVLARNRPILPDRVAPEVSQVLIGLLNRVRYVDGLLEEVVRRKDSETATPARRPDWNTTYRLNVDFLVRSYPEEILPLPPRRLTLTLPFDRYYMEETLAPRAEQAYQASSTRLHQDAYIAVRVLDGVAVIENLFIGGMPIREFLETQPLPKRDP